LTFASYDFFNRYNQKSCPSKMNRGEGVPG